MVSYLLATALSTGLFGAFFIGALFTVAFFGVLFSKAGYSFWRSLWLIIPIADIVVWFLFLAQKWPIHKELTELRMRLGLPTTEDLGAKLQEGVKLEIKGDVPGAIAVYEQIIQFGNDARASLEALKRKTQ